MYPIYSLKYHTLSHKGADPDAEDGFGNTVLHMVVVTDQMVKIKSRHLICNNVIFLKHFYSNL